MVKRGKGRTRFLLFPFTFYPLPPFPLSFILLIYVPALLVIAGGYWLVLAREHGFGFARDARRIASRPAGDARRIKAQPGGFEHPFERKVAERVGFYEAANLFR